MEQLVNLAVSAKVDYFLVGGSLVISNYLDDPEIVEGRVKNLHNVFGSSPFYRITCLDPTVSKAAALNQYAGSGCWWVEDHPSNFHLGNDLGLNSLLVDQHYNQQLVTVNRAYNWEQIYRTIALGE